MKQTAMPEFTLIDSFARNGHFWLPEKHSASIAGQLSFSPDAGVSLEIQGCLLEGDSLDSLAYPVVYGRMADAHCSLFNVRVIGKHISSLGVEETSYRADFLAIGATVPSTVECVASWFRCNHLQFFINRPAFSFDQIKEHEKVRGMTIACRWPEVRSYRVPSAGANIVISGTMRQSCTEDSASLSLMPRIEVRSDVKRDIAWHLSMGKQMCDLLSLLTEETVVPTAAAVSAPDSKQECSLCYEYPISQDETKRNPKPLFSFDDVERIFETLVQKWFSASGVLQDAFLLAVYSHRLRGLTIQSRFLVLTQALEAFSRATTTSEYMPQQEYQKVCGALTDAIPVNVMSDHRQSLKNRIRFGNEYSLRKRMAGLLASLSEEARQLICVDPSAFIGGTVSTRNYLTHYTEDLRRESLLDADLYWAGERLAMFLRVLVLKAIGLEESHICAAIKRHHSLSQIVQLVRGFPESNVAAQ